MLVLHQDFEWCPQVSQMPASIIAMNCLDNGESVENKVNFRNNFLLSAGWWQEMHMKTYRCRAIAQHLDCCLQELILTTRSFITFFLISSMYKSGSHEEKCFHISLMVNCDDCRIMTGSLLASGCVDSLQWTLVTPSGRK